VRDGVPVVSSLDVAERFGKRHDNVLVAVQRLECTDRLRLLNFKEAAYEDAQGKPRRMYWMTRDGFAFLVFGFTGKGAALWKERLCSKLTRTAGCKPRLDTAAV
jgi:Rha family phage regulatory protein